MKKDNTPSFVSVFYAQVSGEKDISTQVPRPQQQEGEKERKKLSKKTTPLLTFQMEKLC